MLTYTPKRLIALLVLISSAALTHTSVSQTVDYFTDNGFANAISSLQHPTSEFFEGYTYIAYQGTNQDAYICAYNHITHKWIGPFLAGLSPMRSKSIPLDNSKVDNHGKPAMFIDTKGYIHLVYGAHGGNSLLGTDDLGTPGKGKMIHLISKNPKDISSWKELDNISHFGTYTQFVKLDNGIVYLFYRHGSHRSDWVYQKSSDDGRTFSPAVSILKHKVTKTPSIEDSWYAWFAKGKGDTISAVYVYHPCADAPNHSNGRFNTYYMRMDCRDDSWNNIRGEKMISPLTKEYADKNTLIQFTGTIRTNHGICRYDSEGNPHLYFFYGKGQLGYQQWTGKTWTKVATVTQNGERSSGDIIVDSPTSTRLILLSTNNNNAEVGWWKTIDSGNTWKKEAVIYKSSPGSSDGIEIGSLVHNYTDENLIVISERVSKNNLFRKMILLGANGPVKRPLSEASQINDILKEIGESSKDAWSGKSKIKEKQAKIKVDNPEPE